MTTVVTLLSNVGTPNNTSYSLTYGVGNIVIGNAGANYNGIPQITLTGGSGSGATAVANISNGAISNITVTNGGSGYRFGETVTVNFRDNKGDSISPNTSVSSVTINNGGAGYGPIPSLQFTAPNSGFTALAEARLSLNSISGVTLLDQGSGYTSPPSIAIIAGKFNYPSVPASLTAVLQTGSGANATVNLVPTLVGNAAQGCGYYLRTVDSQNIKWANAVGNIGNLVIEGALVNDPTEGDWVIAGHSNVNTANGSFPIRGKFINIRARIENYGNGTITSVTADY